MIAILIAYALSAILGISGISCFIAFITNKTKGNELIAVLTSITFLFAAYGCARMGGI